MLKSLLLVLMQLGANILLAWSFSAAFSKGWDFTQVFVVGALLTWVSLTIAPRSK